ncbi:MAG: NnrS family protein, partial [Methylococcales bacterium]|nr:NnrS family protein [Methylococcales bacterium]
HVWIALVDLAFLPCLAYAIAKPILSSGNHKNLIVVALLIFMTLANGLIHLQLLGFTVETANFGNRLMLVTTVLLILLISGRVFPFFTERALSGYRVQQWPIINDASLFATAFLFFIDALFPAATIVNLIAGACVILHAIRFWGWYTHRIWYVPLLWVIYLGYLWMIVGFILMATGSQHRMIGSLATHAFTVGGIGVLTLGMMARVSLGHTGRLLQCSKPIVIAFVLLNLAVALRVLGPIWLPVEYTNLVTWAAGLWIVAFTLFLLTYLPILLTPRADGKTG